MGAGRILYFVGFNWNVIAEPKLLLIANENIFNVWPTTNGFLRVSDYFPRYISFKLKLRTFMLCKLMVFLERAKILSHVPYLPAFLRAFVSYVPSFFVPYMTSSLYLYHVPLFITSLACLHFCKCLTSLHFFKLFKFLTFLTALHFF